MTDLRPCPFCGGKGVLVQTWTSAYIMCQVCGVAQAKEFNVDGRDFVDRAVRKWNWRVKE